ncbi:MAG: polysaccharide biosynthesis tyrosine autokinase [Cocleimonas sp.]|nr:polysaccharide biosynthesis tyrosine autokinase [Cocleimonas sp.]
MTVPVIKTVGGMAAGIHDTAIPVSNVQMIDSSVTPELKRELSLHEIFSIIWRRKWLIGFSILFALTLAMFFTLSANSTYRANATIQIERKGPEVVSFGKTDNLGGEVDSLNDPFFRTRYETLKSRQMLSQVIEETNLRGSLLGEHDKPPLSDRIKTRLGLPLPVENRHPDAVDLPQLLLARLLIQPIDKTHLVEVYYEGRSPQEAKDVVSSLVNNFIKSQIDSHSETGDFAKEFLNKKVEDARERLRISEEALVTYSNKKGILTIDENQTRHVTKLNELNSALVQAEIAHSAAKSKYRAAQRSGHSPQSLSNPVIIDLKSRLVGLEGRYQDKLKLFKPSYPDMKRLQQQINAIRSKLRKESGTIKGAIGSALKAEYLAAKRQEQRLRSELSRFNKKLRGLQDSGVDYNKLKRDVESNARLYKKLLQRVEEVSIASSINTSSIKIVDPAVKPIKKYSPKPSLNLIIGFLSGLFLGLGLAFLREALDQSVRSTEDLQRITGLPVLGLVPKPKKIRGKDMPLAAALKPNAPFSEAYRVLSANVRFTLKHQGGKSLLVTSSSPNEGKTTTACNMACAYAQMGMKVLLVDADLRKPTVATKLKIYNKRGLSNFLGENEDLLSVTQQFKKVSGLYVITSGSFDDDVLRMLSNEKMNFLVKQAEQKFDFVIIDSPPVGGFADTLILSSLASSTLIVADEGKLHLAKIRHTLEQLIRIRSNAVGFLLLNSTNPLVADIAYEKHYKKKESSLLANALSGLLSSNDQPERPKKSKVRGVKKPFWGKPKKGINLGYMS